MHNLFVLYTSKIRDTRDTRDTKKKNLIQIIAMNYNEFYKLFPSLIQERFARWRLLQDLKEPFIKYANVNIQINNITNNIHNTNHINFDRAKSKKVKHVERTVRSMRECYQQHK